jgi:hypothetical protein
MLIALYQECENNGVKSLRLGELWDKYGLEYKPRWADDLLEEWQLKKLARVSQSLEKNDRRYVSLAPAGTRYIESKYGTKDGVGEILAPAEKNLFSSDSIDKSSEILGAVASTTIDSSKWTGIQERLQKNPGVVEKIEFHIREIDNLVEKANLIDSEKARAKAITEALSSLIASPEPEWKAIVELLNSPVLTAILNATQIVQILLSLILGS